MLQRVREYRERILGRAETGKEKEGGAGAVQKLGASLTAAGGQPLSPGATPANITSYRDAPNAATKMQAEASVRTLGPAPVASGRSRRNSTPAEMDLQMMRNLTQLTDRLKPGGAAASSSAPSAAKAVAVEEDDRAAGGSGSKLPVVRDRFGHGTGAARLVSVKKQTEPVQTAANSVPLTAAADAGGSGRPFQAAAPSTSSAAAAPPRAATPPPLSLDVPPPEPGHGIQSPTLDTNLKGFNQPVTPRVVPSHQLLFIAQQGLPQGMARSTWALEDYSILAKMYKGYASSVYQAVCKKSLEQVALKVYHMEKLVELNVYQVYREVRVHSKLQHRNIISLYAVFQQGTDIVMVMEYAAGGDLYKLLHRSGGRLPERQAVSMVLSPFLNALHFMHTQGIVHRDIKPENVLFTDDPHRALKLADFGLAIDLNEERAVTRAGTLDYMAPEVLKCPPKNYPEENKQSAEFYYTKSVDSWAVGVFAYELVVGYPPFAANSQGEAVKRITNNSVEFPEKVTDLARDFISACLSKHPGDRPTVTDMLSHPWISAHSRRRSVMTLGATAGRRMSAAAYLEGSDDVSATQVADEYSADEIEAMISKLKLAKQAAEVRASAETP